MAGTLTPTSWTPQGPRRQRRSSVQNAPAETVDCSALPEDLIVEVGLGYTRARQLDPENLEFMDETLGLPGPGSLPDIC